MNCELMAIHGAQGCGAKVNVERSSLLPPSNESFLPNHFAISPDGRRLAFVATNTDSDESIWIRDLASSRMTQLEGTDRARTPFWSPDSRHLGFFSAGKLNTIDLMDGKIRAICESRACHGAAWNSSDVMYSRLQSLGRCAGSLLPMARLRRSRHGHPSPVVNCTVGRYS
jgi:WD40-like Beta Propeller Repeat